MKAHHILLILLSTAILAPNLHAQSANELTFRQARAARDKAAVDAMEPINRRYKEQLGQLFKRATQAAELDLARAIQAEIQAVGGAAAVAEITGAKPGGAAVSATSATLNRTDLKKLIENTRWDRTGERGQDGYLLFYRNGEINGNGPGLLHFKTYELQPPDIMKIVMVHPKAKTGERADTLIYRIDVSAMTLTFDEAKSTAGAIRSFKYAGPAPKK
jgi:hypothetical protein